MGERKGIKVFEEKKVRTQGDAELEKWYFSIVDVIAILTESPNPRKYWSVLKTRLKAEGRVSTYNGTFHTWNVMGKQKNFVLH